jgi:ribosomal protein S18 acetylase RimI-like enzyme
MDLSTQHLPPGYRIRSPVHEDAEAVTDLMRACDVVIFGQPDTDIQDVRNDWAAPGFDLGRDAWILHGRDGAAVGYACFNARRRDDYDGDLCVRPGESVDVLAPALVREVEDRAREASGGSQAALCFFAADPEAEMRAMLERAGYREVRIFFRMRIDLAPGESAPAAPASPAAPPAAPASSAAPARPGGIEITRMRLGTDDRAMHATIEESFAEHFRHTPRAFEEWWALRTSHPRFDPDLWLLAWDGDRVAGALTACDYSDLGFVHELGVRKAWRGRGIGAALLRRSFEEFRAHGQLRIVLGVDAENEGSVGLYERIGMRVESRHHLMQKRLGA